MNKNQYQQGDVLLTRVDMPQTSKVISQKRCVLAEGEATGHAHIVEDEDAELIADGERILLSLGKQATLTHEEHKPIVLPTGVYEVGKVNEFDYFSLMVRKVQD